MRIELRDVTIEFHKPRQTVLDNLDLTIEKGERVALLGPSGSGKTTLLRLLLGAVPLSGGTTRVGGIDPFGPAGAVTSLRRRTGCIRQRDDLVTGLTGRTNALMSTTGDWRLSEWLAVFCGRTPRGQAEVLGELARRHGIESCLGTRVEHLSGGQRQRVALVRALLARPELLLADEPTSGLDPRNAERVVDGMLAGDVPTVVLATHDLNVAKNFERVVAIGGGRVTYDGPVPDEEALARIYGPAAHRPASATA